MLGTRLSFPRFFQRFTIPSQICPSARAVTFYNGEHCRFAARSEFYRGNLRKTHARDDTISRHAGCFRLFIASPRLSDARASDRAGRARARARVHASSGNWVEPRIKSLSPVTRTRSIHPSSPPASPATGRGEERNGKNFSKRRRLFIASHQFHLARSARECHGNSSY